MKKRIKSLSVVSILLFFIAFSITSCETEELLLNEESKGLDELDEDKTTVDIAVTDEKALLAYFKEGYESSELTEKEIEKYLENDLQTIKELQKLDPTKLEVPATKALCSNGQPKVQLLSSAKNTGNGWAGLAINICDIKSYRGEFDVGTTNACWNNRAHDVKNKVRTAKLSQGKTRVWCEAEANTDAALKLYTTVRIYWWWAGKWHLRKVSSKYVSFPNRNRISYRIDFSRTIHGYFYLHSNSSLKKTWCGENVNYPRRYIRNVFRVNSW